MFIHLIKGKTQAGSLCKCSHCPLPAGGCLHLPRVRRLHEALQPDPGHPARRLPAAGQWTSTGHHPSQPDHGEAC